MGTRLSCVAGPKTRAGVRQGLVNFGEAPVRQAFKEKLDLFKAEEEEDFVDPLEGFLG